MEFVKNYPFEIIYKKLFGKNVRFVSDCEFFPNFDVIIKVQKIYFAKNNEIIFEGKTKTKKILKIGGNMKNLQFELL
jgi:hypothetical protein